MNFKVGDRARVIKTGAVGIVKDTGFDTTYPIVLDMESGEVTVPIFKENELELFDSKSKLTKQVYKIL